MDATPEIGAIPGSEDWGLLLAGPAVTVEYFARLDRRDRAGALDLYAEDARFLGARGREAIGAVMERGLAPNAGHRTRHVVANLTARCADAGVVVSYTVLAHTLDDGGGPPALRTVLDQEMHLRPVPGGPLRIVEHRIFGFDPERLRAEGSS
jgi:hypothetical protein